MSVDGTLARLDELAGKMARLKAEFRAELPEGNLTVLRARVGEESVAFSLGSLDRAVGMATLKSVEDAAPALLGLLRMGADFIPVLCLRRLLEMPPPVYTRATAIVLLIQGSQSRGLVVDEVEGLEDFPADHLSPVDPALPHRKFLWGIISGPPKILLLNSMALLGESLTDTSVVEPGHLAYES